ncbi:hypothetical protein [Nonomuraea sp. B19D2]|uniref:hypothetical protein n=2 Tax=Nonomuraea sp. B19D2 TaxID=3159561 RepID=UPI0032D9F9B8
MLTFFGILALAGVVMVALVVFGGTGDERFLRASAEIEAFARTMRDGERLGLRTVGGMEFEEVRRERGVVVFQQGKALESPYGYAWSPQGDPARLLDDVEWSEDHIDHYFEHLQGAFYSWDGRR